MKTVVRCCKKNLSIVLFIILIGGSTSALSATWSIISDEDEATITPSSTVTIQGDDDFATWYNEKIENNEQVYVYTNAQRLGNIVLRLRDESQLRYAFEFDRTAINDTIWPAIRGMSTDNKLFTRRVELAFGSDSAINGVQGIQPVKLVLVRGGFVVFWVIVLAALLLFFLFLAKNSNILRAGNPPEGESRPPLSLARTQMAYWLFIIVGAYILSLIHISEPTRPY